jgi:hypothetical protein
MGLRRSMSAQGTNNRTNFDLELGVDNAQLEEQQRPDYLSNIWSLCTTLSSEALDAAEAKAKENQFNVDRGDVSFSELVINLASAREVLKDAIETQKLVQLPLTVQKELFANLQAVSKSLQGIMGNADEIVNLGNNVEALTTSIWKYGLHNLSDEVLGYQTKLNQLKQQEVRVKQLVATLEKGSGLYDNLIAASEQVEINKEKINKSRLAIESDAAAALSGRQQIQDELTKASNATNAAQQAEVQAVQLSSAAKTASAEITPLEASIKGFFAEIDSYRRQIATSVDETSKFLTDSNAFASKAIAESNARISTEIDRWNAAAKTSSDAQALALSTGLEKNKTDVSELIGGFNKTEATRIKEATEVANARLAKYQDEHAIFVAAADEKLAQIESGMKARSEETIEKNREEVERLVAELATLKESVKEQIAQATGLGQFGAFQSRQNTIAEGKYLWVGAIGALVTIVLFLTYFIAAHAQSGDLHSAAFWIKLSMNVPLGFLISFCTIQYSRERRLEEEYAFKASISVSLNPYRELIYSILEKEGALADGSYTNFVVDSVRNVFTSPTEEILMRQRSSKGFRRSR